MQYDPKDFTISDLVAEPLDSDYVQGRMVKLSIRGLPILVLQKTTDGLYVFPDKNTTEYPTYKDLVLSVKGVSIIEGEKS